MEELLGKRAAPEKEVELPRKKGKKGGSTRSRDANDTVEASRDEMVRVVPYRKPSADDDVGPVVLLSKQDRAPQLQLSEDRLTVTGHKGFRSVRATHGCYVGTYYCEATVQHLGSSGHCRLGWSSKRAEINAPVGYDKFGVGYRDLEGCKVLSALRSEYGEAFGEGDVIGLFIHLPEGGRPLEAKYAEVVRYKGMLYQVQDDEPDPKPLAGSLIGFSKNGVWQGVAARDVLEGTYYPTVSLFTLPDQAEGASVSLNFGPNFKFTPSAVEGCPAAEPVSILPAKAAAAEAQREAELDAVVGDDGTPAPADEGEDGVAAAPIAAAVEDGAPAAAAAVGEEPTAAAAAEALDGEQEQQQPPDSIAP